MERRPVFLFQRMRPPVYRVPIFEELNRRLGGDLVVCSGPPPHDRSLHSIIADEETDYQNVDLPTFWWRDRTVHACDFRVPFKQYGMPRAILSEEAPRSLTLPLLLGYARHHSVGLALWGHFSSNNRSFLPQRHLSDRYRCWLAQQADACVAYTEGIADLLRPYVPDEQLFIARNTLDTPRLFHLAEDLRRQGRAAVRAHLGLPRESPVLLFLGRLLATKGTDLLLDAFGRLRRMYPDAHLVVIGDGPEREVMEARVHRDHVAEVHFLGPVRDDAVLAPWLAASDVMVQPGYLGLAVNHALAFGVPVVSQSPPSNGTRFHSPEWEYVRHDENGLLVQPHPDVLAEAIAHVLRNHARFSSAAWHFAREHLTLENMVDGLMQAIEFVEDERHAPQ